jgi:hypothetical protein
MTCFDVNNTSYNFHAPFILPPLLLPTSPVLQKHPKNGRGWNARTRKLAATLQASKQPAVLQLRKQTAEKILLGRYLVSCSQFNTHDFLQDMRKASQLDCQII